MTVALIVCGDVLRLEKEEEIETHDKRQNEEKMRKK